MISTSDFVDVRYLVAEGGSGSTRMPLQDVPEWITARKAVRNETVMIIALVPTSLRTPAPDRPVT